MNMPEHLFVCIEGNLYDTRKERWASLPPLRVAYRQHHQEIDTAAKLAATLRAGEYTFPGGYRLAFITKDGDWLSFDAVMAEFKQQARQLTEGGWHDTVCGLDNVDEYDELPIWCAITNEPLNYPAENLKGDI